MKNIFDLFDFQLFDKMLEEGFIRESPHPELDLMIFNYSERAAYEGVWNAVTLQCRGLIAKDDCEIVARPFPKFFNYGQNGAPTIDLESRAIVTDKLDGSLGILYPTPWGSYAIATRGSFVSDQAIRASQIFKDKYSRRCKLDPKLTYLVEIIYPENKIVVDYGDVEDLFLLAVIDTNTGKFLHGNNGWVGPVVRHFVFENAGAALAAPPRENAEGLVLFFPSTGDRIKVKQEDYVELHRIVTGLSARRIWQSMIDGWSLHEILEPLPDEFHEWALKIANGLQDEADALELHHKHNFGQTLAHLTAWNGVSWNRKDFAHMIKDYPDKWAMFALLDAKDIKKQIWKGLKPEGNVTPQGRTFSEDTA